MSTYLDACCSNNRLAPSMLKHLIRLSCTIFYRRWKTFGISGDKSLTTRYPSSGPPLAMVFVQIILLNFGFMVTCMQDVCGEGLGANNASNPEQSNIQCNPATEILIQCKVSINTKTVCNPAGISLSCFTRSPNQSDSF